MSFVVISCFDNADTGNLQADGDAVAVLASEALARKHFVDRCALLASAARGLLEHDANATLIAWVVVLRMPIEVGNVEEALEDLETILEENAAADDPFEELVIDYAGAHHTKAGSADHPRGDAMRALRLWLT